MKLIDITGYKFNRITVVSLAESKNKRTMWNCKCDCGKTFQAESYNIKNGNTKSCGCFNAELVSARRKNHGLSSSSSYKVWCAMMERCNNPDSIAYRWYGGRGITVCSRWRSFENFYRDMGDKPPFLSIDRIDNNGGYYPGNCRWATSSEQNRNKRSNKLTMELAENIRGLYSHGDFSVREIMVLFSISPRMVRSVIKEHSWRKVSRELER